mgnify:FL=1
MKAALDAGLYVIINIHWEGGWLNHPVDANKEALDERLEAMWKQIALRFRDYDDRLLFAGTNEVNNDDANGAQPTEENYRVQNGFNQVFVNTVRATGGRNHYRHLIVQHIIPMWRKRSRISQCRSILFKIVFSWNVITMILMISQSCLTMRISRVNGELRLQVEMYLLPDRRGT